MTLVERLREQMDHSSLRGGSRLLRESADRIEALEKALGDMMNEHTPLGQHENGEIEYCSGSACRNAYDALHPPVTASAPEKVSD